MKKIFAMLLCTVMLFSSFSVFAAEAATDETDPYAFDEEYYSRFEGQDITLYVYNWGEYIADGSEGSEDVIQIFEDLTGIDVEYTTFDTNEAMYAKLASGGGDYDIIVPSDYMISRMIEEDMLAELDFSNIPNFQYIDEAFRNPAYDPENRYSVPYTWGLVGLFYNTDYVTEEEAQSWNVLWDEKYAGISSMKLLLEVKKLLDEKGAAVINVSAVILAQKPKLKDHIPAMSANIAQVLGIPEERVSISATTTEGIGLVGREEGISARACALVLTNSAPLGI